MPRGQWFPSFAAGVAVALVGVGGFVGLQASASSSATETTFVPVTPCRLVDTRPGEPNVGPRATPIGAGESILQQVTGTNGDCTIPADAVGVALNVTAVNATARTFLTIYPADAPLPTASNLNVVAGQAPTPNKVDVKLSSSGAIRVYNDQGTVNLIADIAGYYTGKGLASLQAQVDAKANKTDVYTKAEIDALLAAKADEPAGSTTIVVGVGAFSIAHSVNEDLTFIPIFGNWSSEGTPGPLRRCLLAPVELPGGATIDGVRSGWYMDGAGGAGTVQLQSVVRGSAGNSVDHATVATTEMVGAVEFAATTIISATVADSRSYWLYACLSDDNADLEYVAIDITI